MVAALRSGPEYLLSLTATTAGSLQCTAQGALANRAGGIVFPAPHKWYPQSSGISGIPWLCLPSSPSPAAAHQTEGHGWDIPQNKQDAKGQLSPAVTAQS